MQMDAFGYAKLDEWSDWLSVADPSEVSAFYEGVAAGLSFEVPDEPAKAKARARTPPRAKARAMAEAAAAATALASSSSRAAPKVVVAKVTGSNSNSRAPVARVETARPTFTAAGAMSQATWRATAASARPVSLASPGPRLGPPTQSSKASRNTPTTPSRWANAAWAA